LAESNIPSSATARTRRGPRASLRGSALLVAGATYGVIALIALGALWFVGERIARDLGAGFAERMALWHKERASAKVGRNLALARQLADNPDLKAWARAENDPGRRQRAVTILKSYRERFDTHAYFVALPGSRHFYFNERGDGEPLGPPDQTLKPADTDDSWYFHTVESGAFNINVDHNDALDTTKVWLNVPIKDGGEVLGVAGTGVDLSRFIDQLASPGRDGVTTMLANRKGIIQAHPEKGRIAFNAPARQASVHSLYRRVDGVADSQRLRTALDRLATGESNVEVLELSLNGTRRLVAAAWVDRVGWYSVTVIDLRSVLGWSEFLTVGGVLAAALAASLALLAVLLDPLVLRPIRRLSTAVSRVAEGDYAHAEVPARRADEIGTLSRGFNHMTATLHAYTERLEERVAVRTRQLERANQELARTNGALMDSLTYASRLQTALLPETGVLERMTEHVVLWRPRDVVGGDLYVGRATDNGIYVGVIDCTGHGVPGALMTMAAYAAFGYAMARTDAGPPAEVLTEMDRYMRQMLARDPDASADHGLEMGLLRWSPDTGELRYAGGGIDLLAVDPGSVDPEDPGGAVIPIKGDRASLGYRARKKADGFTEHRLAVPHGRAFYLASDGFIDQVGGPRRLAFGRRRLHRLLAENAGRPMADQAAHLERALAEWQGEESQRDDITVVGIRPRAADGAGDRQDGRTGA